MGKNSGIEWTHHTFNPWIGCTKVSPACANCYAERDFDHRYRQVKWGPDGFRKVTSDANWRKPIQWNAEAAKSGIRERVFCASLADVFEDWQGYVIPGNPGDDPETLDEVRKRLFDLIDQTPYLDWLLLTKRPENIRRLGDCRPRQNVWLGTSVENQEWADKRIPELLNCRNLTPVLFLSCEPVVGHISLTEIVCVHDKSNTYNALDEFDCDPIRREERNARIDWVITGGESGPNARPADPDWFRGLRDQCIEFNVPFHFKQWGEFDQHQVRVGKKNAGRLLDGVEWNQVPETREVVR